MDNVLIFFGASVAVAMLGMVVAFMGVQYHKALKEISRLKVENDRILKSETDEINKILDQARSNGLTIVKDAQMKAQQIIKESDAFSSEFKSMIQGSYGQITQDIKAESNKTLQTISKDIENQIDAEVKTFHKQILDEATRAQRLISQNAEEDYKQIRGEIEAYKKAMLDRVDAAAVDMVKDIAKQVLGASLTSAEHQKLVLQALKEAKENHVL